MSLSLDCFYLSMAGLFYLSAVWHEVLMYLKLLRSYHAFLLVYLHVHTHTQTLFVYKDEIIIYSPKT